MDQRKEIASIIRRVRRRLLVRRAAGRVTRFACAAAGIAAVIQAGLVAAAWHRGITPAPAQWRAPLALIPLAAGAGALVAWLRRPSAASAATFLDRQLNLQERMSTAWSLISTGKPLEGLEPFVLAEARRFATADGPGRAVPLRLPRRASAAALSVLMLCSAVALLPLPPGSDQPARRLAEVIDELSPAQRAALADALRRQAGPTADGDALRRAALHVELQQGDPLAQLLNELAAGGTDWTSALPADIYRKIGLAGEGSAAGPDPPQPPPLPPPARARGTAAVYDPLAHATDKTAPPRDPPTPAGEVPLDAAWNRARSLAADQLADGTVPASYRPLIRRYFRPWDED